MRSYLTGKPVLLYERIAESGEGMIYRSDAGMLVKIYHGKEDSKRMPKLKAMLDRPPHDPTWKTFKHLSIAWPQDIILDEEGRCAGFSMPHIQNASDLTHVYNPAYRQRFAPRFNWYYLHQAARNYTSAVDALHTRGYVIGDIKPQNVMVSSNALITIVDADSFQVRDEDGHVYRCPVGSEGFTAPELLDRLQGQSFAALNRRKRHDRFGMAIIVYLLLFGRHPFSEGRFRGRGDPPGPDDRIRAGLWGHAHHTSIEPDPATVPLTCIHPELAQAFRQCFDDGHRDPSLRPRASQWRNALDSALHELTACEREPNHYYWRGYGHCLWCERAKMLGLDVYAIEPPRLPPKPAPPPPKPKPQPKKVAPAAQKPARSVGNFAPWLVPLIIAMRAIPSCLSGTGSTPTYYPPSGIQSPSTSPEDINKLLNDLNNKKSRPFGTFKSLNASGKLKSVYLNPVQFVSSKPHSVRSGYIETEYMGILSIVNKLPEVSTAVSFKVSYPETYDVTGRNTYVGFYGQVYRKDLGPDTEKLMRNLTSFEMDESWQKENE
jgi:serine/threonine protein kinase